MLAGSNFTIRNAARHILTAMWHSAGFVKLIAPAGQALTLQEFQNKLGAFCVFEQVDSALNPHGSLSLPHLLTMAKKLGPYFSVWATEGVGHYIAERHLAQGGSPYALLSKSGKVAIPRETLVPLNAGMGLAFAEWILEAADRERRIDWPVVRKFLDLCLSNCTPGSSEVCFEAFGLVTRSLYPHVIPAIDAILCQHCPELLGYFWHGVGRAAYFSPTQALPLCGGTGRGIAMSVQESPHVLGKRNAVAGYVWALTLVNIRHPGIVAAFLNQYGRELDEEEAFVNGLCSALLVWRNAQPDERHIGEFIEYQPGPSGSPLSKLWRTQVRQPWTRILRRSSAATEGQGLSKLFQYQPFTDLLASAGRTRAAEQL